MVILTPNSSTTEFVPGNDDQDLRNQILAIASAVPGLIYTFRMRADGTVSMPFATPAIYDIFGVPPDQVAADFTGAGELIHPDDVERTYAAVYESARTMTPWRQEFRVRHPVRGERWIEGNSAPIHEPDGGILWRGYMHDITERKAVEEALHYKNEVLVAQQEASIDGILVVNTDFTISSMNSRFAEIWRLPQDIIDRRNHKEILDFATPMFARSQEFTEIVQQLYRNPAGRSHDELPLKDGRIIERHSASLSASDGQSCGRLWTFRDITEVRKAQQALLESERFARSTLDSLSAHIAILDAEGRILATNRSWTRFANENDANPSCVLEGANYLSVCDAIVGADRFEAESFAHGVRDVLVGAKESYALEYPCHSPTEQRWFVGRVTRFIGDGPIRLVIAHENITERVVALNSLRESKALLSEMGQTAKIGGWEIDLATNTKTWTDEVARIHGVPLDIPMTIKEAMDFYVGESRAIMIENLKAACEVGRPFDLELEFLAADGVHKWARTIGHPEWKDGRIVRVAGSFQDITDKKKVEIALRESETLFSTIFQVSPIAINIFRLSDGRSITVNDGYTALTGFSREEIIGHTAIELGLFPDPKARLPQMNEMMEHGSAKMADARIRSKSGLMKDALVSLNALTLNGEKTAIVVATDITDRKRAEAELQKLQEGLVQAQKMEAVGRLAGGVAHDFNNLLGVIIGNLDLLERRVVTDEASLKRVHTAQRAATRGAELTKRMLALSSREKLYPTAMRIEDSVQAAIEFAAQPMGSEIEIVTHFDSNIPLVMADAGELENALLNILVNARDAMPRGGRISVTTCQATLHQDHDNLTFDGVPPGAYISIKISDNGEGMSRETLERAFEPFYTTKPQGKGTGIGLAMVYGFFKQSGGTVRLYSEPGYGTTVSCYLPIAGSGDIPPREERDVPSADMITGHETILLVDDEVDLLEIASIYLQDLGYTVLCAASGLGALALVEKHPEIDLLVTDIIMPGGMNGAELAEQARDRLPRLRIIYASGFPSDVLAERKMSMANGILLHKPYQRSELVALVRNVLTNKSAIPNDADIVS